MEKKFIRISELKSQPLRASLNINHNCRLNFFFCLDFEIKDIRSNHMFSNLIELTIFVFIGKKNKVDLI